MQLTGVLSRGAVEALVVLKYSSTGFVRTHHIEPLVLSQFSAIINPYFMYSKSYFLNTTWLGFSKPFTSFLFSFQKLIHFIYKDKTN